MAVELYDHQITAIDRLKNGSILVGGVGTGKSRTALAYYYLKVCGGQLKINGKGSMGAMTAPRDLYIITTAKKRDSLEWTEECVPFCLSEKRENSLAGVKVTVDSWNNIKKYKKVFGAFFIFDEQRVIGYGAWTKAFLDITRKNQWILLSATPGDTWLDYMPVFIANGFYKNKTEFAYNHIVYASFSKYRKVDHYVNQGVLIRHRNDILVLMNYERKTERHKLRVTVLYDKALYKRVWKDRWDPYENEPIRETGKLFYLLRRVVNSDPSRIEETRRLLRKHKRAIIFYNFTYELNALRALAHEEGLPIGEWNGEVHSEVPTGERWVYLVQYTAGAEGWNCITTDTMIFFSQSYSYRMTEQAAGRIDRMNTKYKDLYYYYLKSPAPIDLAISRALAQKKDFNQKSFLKS